MTKGMDWDRWWTQEGMPHAFVRVNGDLLALRICTDWSQARGCYAKLELLTGDGWKTLHIVNTSTKDDDAAIKRLARYAESIYAGRYDYQDNSNTYPDYEFEE